MTPLRLLLVDAHEVSRRGLHAIIQPHHYFEIVGEAANGPSALSVAERERPDVAVLEFAGSGFGILWWVESLNAVRPGIRVVVVTAHEERGFVRSALDGGVAGYVLKRSPTSVLRQALAAMIAGRVYVDPAVSEYWKRGHAISKSDDLSRREQQVLALVALGYRSKDMAAKLRVSVKTVETYRYRATVKLGITTRADLVRYGLSRGWMTAGADSFQLPASPDRPNALG